MSTPDMVAGIHFAATPNVTELSAAYGAGTPDGPYDGALYAIVAPAKVVRTLTKANTGADLLEAAGPRTSLAVAALHTRKVTALLAHGRNGFDQMVNTTAATPLRLALAGGTEPAPAAAATFERATSLTVVGTDVALLVAKTQTLAAPVVANLPTADYRLAYTYSGVKAAVKTHSRTGAASWLTVTRIGWGPRPRMSASVKARLGLALLTAAARTHAARLDATYTRA